MKTARKSLAMLLCIVMCLSLFPVTTAWADEPAEVETTEEETLAHEHDYTATVTAPTCTERGYTTYSCACGDSYVADYTEPQHQPVDVPEVPATTEAAGTTAGKKCSVCGAVLEGCTEIPKLVIEAKEPVESGTEEPKDKPEAGSAHEHDYTAVVTAPTCTEQGYTTYICECGDSYVDNYVDATGHTPEDVAEVPATTEAAGITAGKKCAVCGEILEGCTEIQKLNIENTASQPAVRSDAKGAIQYSGTWGSLSWALDYNGQLTIYGNGSMNSISVNDAWRAYSSRIITVKIRTGVTNIAERAFYGCSNLRTIEFEYPSKVTSIARDAFYESSLTSIDIPSSLTSIGRNAFFRCSNLSSISIPKNVKSIDEFAFNASGLRSVEFQYGITTIWPYAFCDCQYLKSVTIPSSVTVIDDAAFLGCSLLTDISFPSTLKRIGDSAFGDCRSLETVRIPGSVTDIGEAAFKDCIGLVTVIIPSNITRIRKQTFYNCIKLSYIKLPGVQRIDAYAFYNCRSLVGYNNDGSAPFSEYDTVFNNVYSISEYAFYYCFGLTNITFPESLAFIGSNAFYGCTGVTKMSFEGDMPGIGENAFGYVNATVNYPASNVTYTEENKIGYGGTLTWIPIGGWTVSYHPNGGSGEPPAQIKNPGISLKLSATIPTYESEKVIFTVTLNANGGTVDVNTLRSEQITSYSFKSWNTKRDGTGTGYNPGGSYTTDENVILYAQWSSTTATTAVILPTPVKEEYSFQGWSLSPSSGDGIKGEYTPTENVTLYAIWKTADPVEEYVKRCYRLLLGREGDAGGVNYWVNQLKSGAQGGASIVDSFVSSKEFENFHLSNEGTVARIYQTMLNREPDSGGLAYWQSFMDDGTSAHYIVNGFSGATEFKNLCGEYGISPGRITLTQYRDRNLKVTQFVNRNYLYALERSGDAGGLNYWCEKIIRKQQTPQQCAQNFVFSQECVNRNLSNEEFVKMLYRLYMGREADAGGLNYWLGQMQKGMNRQAVANNFANSPEFKNIVKSYGL